MATAKKTSFSDAFVTLEGLESAAAMVRKDGAASDSAIFLFPLGVGYTLKAEWSEEIADPNAPAADEREQPVQYATGDVVPAGGVAVILHEGEALVQPDGIVNDTPKAGA